MSKDGKGRKATERLAPSHTPTTVRIGTLPSALLD